MGAYLSGADLSGAILDNISLAGADLRYSILRGAMCRGTRFGTSELNMADLRGADLTEANLETIESIKGSDFSMCKGMAPHIQRFLERSALELDHWNPLTRSTTRSSTSSVRGARQISRKSAPISSLEIQTLHRGQVVVVKPWLN